MPYWVALIFVVAVSGVDSWMCFQSEPDTLKAIELNPVCRYLLDQGGVEMLVSVKLVGTSTVVMAVQELKAKGYRHLKSVLLSLVFVQMVVVGSYVAYHFMT